MGSTARDIQAFASAIWADWVAKMSGAVGVLLALLAPWVSNDALQIALGIAVFVCISVAAYRVWKQEHDQVQDRSHRKRQLLDEIAGLRSRLVKMRIEMQKSYLGGKFNEDEWRAIFDAMQTEIAAKIEEFSSKAEAETYLYRGNIHRAVDAKFGGYAWPVLIDVCIHDLDHLKTFIHEYSRHREQHQH